MSGLSQNTQDGARLDIAVEGFWDGVSSRGHFCIKVFNPYAPLRIKTAFTGNMREVEHASFTPLILSCTGGLGPHVSTIKLYAPASKWSQAYIP